MPPTLYKSRVCHGYTAGMIFPHRTRTRQNRTRTATGMVSVGMGTVFHETRGIPYTRGYITYFERASSNLD
jgi:hypothetical protein